MKLLSLTTQGLSPGFVFEESYWRGETDGT